MNFATNASRAPAASGGGERHCTDSMLAYHSVALSGSAAYAATSVRGRAMVMSVTTSTGTSALRRQAARVRDAAPHPLVQILVAGHAFGRDEQPALHLPLA